MIKGNTTIKLQVKSGFKKNEIGESVQDWQTVHEIKGWLDLQSGDSRTAVFNAKIQESTHLFICDYIRLDKRVQAETCRLLDKDNRIYDVKLIDNPMGLDMQLEIYLKFTGGQ